MTATSKPAEWLTIDLRKLAEQRIPKKSTDVSGMSAAELESLVYELAVHREELEIQNEELRRVQLELQQSRDRYADLYDFAPVGYLLLDAEGSIVEANLTAAAMLGVNRSKLIGTRLSQYCELDSRTDLRSYIDEIFANGKRRSSEFDFTGDVMFRAHLESRRVSGADGGAPRCLVVMSDVTDRRDREERLATKARVLDRMAEGVTLTDHNGVIFFTNPAFDAMFGYERGELNGKHASVLNDLAESESRKLVDEIGIAMNTVGTWFGEFPNRRKDGSRFFTTARISELSINGRSCWVAVQQDVTEQRRANDEIRRSQQQFELMAKASPSLVFRADANGQSVYTNDEQWAHFTGLPAGSWRGDGWASAVHPDDRQRAFDSWQQCVAAGKEWNIDFRFHRADGSDVWVLGMAVPFQNEAGDPDGYIGTCTDITERRSSELALLSSEQRLKLALDAGRMGTWDWDVQTNEVIWSDGHFRLLGYELGEIQASYQAWTARIHADDLRMIEKHVAHARESRCDYTCDYRVIWPDGSTHWVSGRGRFNYDADGKAVRMYGVVVDIDEQKLAEEQLHIRDRSLQACRNGITITDATHPDNPIVYCNPAFERITGYAREEIIGRNCRFLQAEDRDQPQLKAIRLAVKKGRAARAVVRNYRKDGTLFWNELHIAPVPNQQNEVTHFVGIQNDITDRVLAEQALVEKDKYLRSLADSLTVLIGYLDTELRFQFCNAAYAEWFGLSPEDLKGQRMHDVLGDGFVSEIESYLADAMDGRRVDFESPLTHQDMGRRDVQIMLVPDAGPDGNVKGIHCLCIDITERKVVDEQNRRRRRFAERLSRLDAAENDVYKLLIRGKSNKAIAYELDIGLRTAERRRQVILEKLEVESLAELLQQLADIQGIEPLD